MSYNEFEGNFKRDTEFTAKEHPGDYAAYRASRLSESLQKRMEVNHKELTERIKPLSRRFDEIDKKLKTLEDQMRSIERLLKR